MIMLKNLFYGLSQLETPVLRAAAWLLILAIVVLSLSPPQFRPTTGAPHDFEHLAIFIITGLAFGLGYRCRHSYQAAGLISFAGVVEIAQFLIPGRHARLGDFFVDAASASVGSVVAWIIVRVTRG